MKPKRKFSSPDFGYVTIKTFPHFGEKAVPHKHFRVNSDGETERDFVILDCVHNEHLVFLKRSDI